MKRVVTGGELAQHAMRPPELVRTYLAMVERDAAAFGLLDGGQARACPACGGDGRDAFQRLGFTYQACARCASLFVSPAPASERLEAYQHESAAERFWRDELLTATANVRSRHAVGPRAQWVAVTAAARRGTGVDVAVLGDHVAVRGDRAPAIVETLRRSSVVRTCAAAPADAPAPSADVVVAFDVLERRLDLSGALARARALVREGGLLFVTTLSGSGFDVRLLRGATPSIVPPIHLQLLSRAGWIAALERAGFRLVEYSTPGELDVQAVMEACRADASIELPAVLDELVRHEDPAIARGFQELLQQAGLSSHVQLVAVA
jgi:hypothetical protein